MKKKRIYLPISHYSTKKGSNHRLETFEKAPGESNNRINIVRPTTFDRIQEKTTRSNERLARALKKSEIRPLAEWKYLYVSSDGNVNISDKLDPKIIHLVSHAKMNYRKWSSIMLVLGSLGMFIFLVVRPNFTNAGKDEIYQYAQLILSSNEDYMKRDEFLSRDEFEQMRKSAFSRLYSFCENCYNWPLLKNCRIVDIWAQVLNKVASVGTHNNAPIEDETSLLYMTKALNRLLDGHMFHSDIQQVINPNDLAKLIELTRKNLDKGSAFTQKQKTLLITQLVSLGKRFFSSLDPKLLKNNDFYTKTIESFITSDYIELKRIGYYALLQFVASGRIEDFPVLKSFYDRIYDRYTANVNEFKKISDPEIKQTIGELVLRHTNYGDKSKLKDFAKKTGISWDYIRDTFLESDISKTGQIFILGGPSWILFRSYWRYWRFGGLNGRHTLFNYAFPHAKASIVYMAAIFAYHTLATYTWERQLFYKSETAVTQHQVPLLVAVKYAPIIGGVAYLIFTNPTLPFLILPLIYGLSYGKSIITSALIGYEKESRLSLEELKRIRNISKAN
jgi:hypothetical protein